MHKGSSSYKGSKAIMFPYTFVASHTFPSCFSILYISIHANIYFVSAQDAPPYIKTPDKLTITLIQSGTQTNWLCCGMGNRLCSYATLTSCEVMNSLCETLLFVVKSSCCSQILSHLQFFWAPGGDDGHSTKQTGQLDRSCSNSAGAGVSQHNFTRLHLSCDGKIVTQNSFLSHLNHVIDLYFLSIRCVRLQVSKAISAPCPTQNVSLQGKLFVLNVQKKPKKKHCN